MFGICVCICSIVFCLLDIFVERTDGDQEEQTQANE